MSGRSQAAWPKLYAVDNGCHLHPSCLECPRAVCVYDEIDGTSASAVGQAVVRRRNATSVAAAKARAREVMAMSASGASVAEISRCLGVAERTVYRDLNLNGVSPGRGKHLTEAQKAEIDAMLHAGVGVNAVARAVGVSQPTVSRRKREMVAG